LDWCVGLKSCKTFSVQIQIGSPFFIIHVRWGIGDEWRQHIEPGKVQDAVVDGEENLVDVPVESIGLIHCFRPTGTYRYNGPFSFEGPIVVEFAATIDTSHHEDAIGPAFQDGWQTEPPQGKLQDQEITPFELFDFSLDIGAKTVILGSVNFFKLLFKIVDIVYCCEVVPAGI
jgi:hypothetical protein